MGDSVLQDIPTIQTHLEALAGLIRPPTAPAPMRHENREINALLNPWLQAISCLNLEATHQYCKRVLQFLEQKLDTVKLALAENITLRFDVLMLAIVSRDYCVEH